jgi:hypothetical protein
MSEESYEKEWKLFEETFNTIHPQIQAKLAEAAKALREATTLAEKHGIPFRPQVGTPFRMSYIPDSFEEKFPEVSKDGDYAWSDLTNAHSGGDYAGWQQSQTC